MRLRGWLSLTGGIIPAARLSFNSLLNELWFDAGLCLVDAGRQLQRATAMATALATEHADETDATGLAWLKGLKGLQGLQGHKGELQKWQELKVYEELQ
jgi:hypothetical protein